MESVLGWITFGVWVVGLVLLYKWIKRLPFKQQHMHHTPFWRNVVIFVVGMLVGTIVLSFIHNAAFSILDPENYKLAKAQQAAEEASDSVSATRPAKPHLGTAFGPFGRTSYLTVAELNAIQGTSKENVFSVLGTPDSNHGDVYTWWNVTKRDGMMCDVRGTKLDAIMSLEIDHCHKD